MNKKEHCAKSKIVAYYSGLNGLEIKDIEYGINDYIYCMSGCWGGTKKRYHRCKIYYPVNGSPFFKVDGYKILLDECLRM